MQTYKKYISWTLKGTKGAYVGLLICDGFIFCTHLYFLGILTQFINPTAFKYDLSLGYNVVGMMVWTVCLRLFLALLRISLTVRLKKSLLSKIMKEFSCYNEASTLEGITTLVTRDVQILLEFSPHFHFPLYALFILILMFFGLISLKGMMDTLLFATIGMFIPLSGFIAKKSRYYAEKIYHLSKQRIEMATFYLKNRPYLINWSCADEALKPLEAITEEEIKARSQDSWWRSLDLYSIIFGRGVPLLGILFAATVLHKAPHLSLLEIWLVVPCIALIMEAGRFSSDVVQAKQAFLHYRSLLTRVPPQGPLILDSSWDIWDGTVADNCFDDLNPNSSLYDELRLTLELSQGDRVALKSLTLKRGGSNVSHGQKVRLLIIRALHLAIAEKKPLHIMLPLNGLDPDICLKLQALIHTRAGSMDIRLSDENQSLIKSQIERSPLPVEEEYSKQPISPPPSSLAESEVTYTMKGPQMIKLLPKITLLFLIPALFLNLYPIVIESTASIGLKAGMLAALLLGGIIFASGFGYYTEKSMRERAKLLFIKLLSSISLSNIADAQQRASKDFTTVLERLAWYIHDLAWYTVLLCCVFLSISWAFGSKGVLMSMVIGGIFTGYYVLCTPKLARAREMFIHQVNEALHVLYNLTAIGAFTCENLHKKSHEIIAAGINLYTSGYLKNYIIRDLSARLITFLMDSSIAGVCLMAQFYESHLLLGFVLNALLSMQSVIILFFQALVGLYAQYASWQRLHMFAATRPTRSMAPSLVRKHHGLMISRFCHPELSFAYSDLLIPISKPVTLGGRSGKGKTSYLKAIAAFGHEMLESNVLYLDENARAILEHVKGHLSLLEYLQEKILSKQHILIILDESLSSYDRQEAKKLLLSLERILAKGDVSMILVDHRFELEDHFMVPIVTHHKEEWNDSVFFRTPVMVD